jgi:hypothetical protein
MILTETLKVLRMKEMETGHLLKDALSLQRSCVSSNFHFLRNSDAFSLLTVNSKARIKWGTVFVEEMFDFFKIADDENGPTDPLFLVTIADKFHLTTDQPQQINLLQIKRKLGAGLMDLSYIGMIEPGYYNVIYDEFGNQRKNVISWHGHCLVWGVSEKQLAKHLAKIKPRFTPITPGLCAVHKKIISPDQFGYKLWYILKAPRKEYSIGQRRECDARTHRSSAGDFTDAEVGAVIAKAKLAGMWREKVEQTNSGPVIVEVNRPPSELTGEPDASVPRTLVFRAALTSPEEFPRLSAEKCQDQQIPAFEETIRCRPASVPPGSE